MTEYVYDMCAAREACTWTIVRPAGEKKVGNESNLSPHLRRPCLALLNNTNKYPTT